VAAVTFSCYRFVRTDPPTIRDFLSNAEAGKRLRAEAGETEEQWRGLSGFDSLTAAQAMLRRVPRFPLRLVALLELPDDAPVRSRKTFGPGHYTLWGEPELLLGAVVAVIRVEP
jgi:hypothetical protein